MKNNIYTVERERSFIVMMHNIVNVFSQIMLGLVQYYNTVMINNRSIIWKTFTVTLYRLNAAPK